MKFLSCVISVSVIGDPVYNARYVLDVTLVNPSSTAKVRVFYPNQVQNLSDYVDVDNCQRVFLLNLFPYFDGRPASLDVVFPLAGGIGEQSIISNKSPAYKRSLNE